MLKQISLVSLCIGISLNCIAQDFQEFTLLHEGESREYSMYLPDDYDGETPLPLLFNFHGGNGDIASQIYVSDMRGLADDNGFIVVYPQALPDPNDDGSTNWLHKDPTDIDDIFFVEAMIDEIATSYAIDETRVYACGYSLGGEFTYELACRLNDKIAAIGAVARTMGTAAFHNCAPTHPTGILTILGTDDTISPYDGLFWAGEQYYLSAEEMHNYWVEYNQTETEFQEGQLSDLDPNDGSTVKYLIWANGEACVRVEHLKVEGGGHDWPGTFGNMDIDASEEIWNFVSQFSLQGLIACESASTHTTIASSSLRVFPNPATNYLRLDVGDNQIQAYELFSIEGELMRSGMLGPTKQIDLSGLASRIYLLKCANQWHKFVKTN